MGKKTRARSRLHCAYKAGLILGVALPFGAAFAQASTTAPAPASDATPSDSSAQLDTVTVTAQRRTENIKDVPISVSTLKGEALDVLQSGGQDVRVLAAKTPSLNIESSNGRTFPRFYIRGYGNTDFSTFASQPVSLVYDDVVQENAALKGFPIFDLADVEVLRGPQGTLFGRNTPAGVVKFDSAKPSLSGISGYFSASDATHNTANVEGAVNVPLSDQWALRFSALGQHRDDWVTNDGGGTPKEEGYNERAGRLQLLYQPDGTFNALFNIHARETTGSARLFRANIIEPGTNNFVSGFDPDRTTTNAINNQSLSTNGGSIRLTWNLDKVKLYSITGYEAIGNYSSRGDIDGGTPTGPGFIPFQVQTSGGVLDDKQYSQEFRVESKNEGPWNWQAGLYYFNEDVTGFANEFNDSQQQTSHLVNRQKNTASAVFGSLTYDVNDKLKLRGGLRYTEDKKDFSTLLAENVTFTGPGSLGTNASNVSGDISANYALTDAVSTYARVATGFRAPSIAAPSTTSNAPITKADSETITSYEAGVKADLFNRRARVSFSVYDYDIKNQQLTAVGGASNNITLINAKKTAGRGAELDLQAKLTDRLLLSLGGSYNFTQIKDPDLLVGTCASCTILDPTIGTGTGRRASIDGNSLPQAPKWITYLTARYGIPMGNNDELYFYTDWSYRSKINFFLYDSTEFTGKSLLEGGLRVGYKWQGDKYEIAAFARNITNKVVAVGGVDFDNVTTFINEPRVVGLQFRTNF